MANPRQRRKARSGVGKVKQSRRQQGKLRKVVVTGPEVLRKEWDVKKTALQNLEKLGLARRPLALRQNGGTEKQLDALDNDAEEANQSDDDDDAYASEDDSADDMEDVATNSEQPEAGPSNSQPPMDKKSKDIPKGFARIIRDAQGNVVDVVMSAYDEPDEEEANVEAEGDQEQLAAEDDEDVETPWGKPLVSREHERQLKKAAQPVPAKSAGLRQLEEQSAAERQIKASSLRYASSAEQDYLRTLVKKHGTDVQAMAKDFKLNQDQRTAGQLRKAFARCGGVEAFLA